MACMVSFSHFRSLLLALTPESTLRCMSCSMVSLLTVSMNTITSADTMTMSSVNQNMIMNFTDMASQNFGLVLGALLLLFFAIFYSSFNTYPEPRTVCMSFFSKGSSIFRRRNLMYTFTTFEPPS